MSRVALVIALCLANWLLPPRAFAQSASEALSRLFEDAWEFDLREDPLAASQQGDHRYDDRLPSVSLADVERRLAAEREFTRRWSAIDRDGLSSDEAVSHELFGRLRKEQIAEYEFRSYLTPITNRSGFHISFPDLPRETSLRVVKDYENYIARLLAFRAYSQGHIDLLRAGVEAGVVLPAIVLRGFEKPLEAQIVAEPTDSLLYGPFKSFPATFGEEDRDRLAAAGREAIEGSVIPAYREFLEFMGQEYVPAARGSIGASALPNGRDFYRHRVRQFTTLDLSPEEVHRVGVEEVARIKEEMFEAIEKVGFQGDFAAFVEYLRAEPKFYADSPEALLKEVAHVMKKMDGQLPTLFKTLPRAPYGIREIPAFIAPSTTTAYYSPPAGDGSRAGFYYVNTYDIKSRPLYEVEALSLHEAVPGHHLQIALQQELENLPNFRRFASFTAFVEGWALYAERLGLETGFYQDPYSDFGRLSFEMWRACRLVVDTGIHYLGWTREQAIDYMLENTALARVNVVNEVDRYIAWPGQALGYKIGELKIRELRRRCEEKLGTAFDIREFHEIVLNAGAIPLDVLERRVDRYLAEKDSAAAE